MTYLQFNACQQLRKANAHLCTSHESGLYTAGMLQDGHHHHKLASSYIYIYNPQVHFKLFYSLRIVIRFHACSFDPSDQMLLEGLVEEIFHEAKLEEKFVVLINS